MGKEQVEKSPSVGKNLKSTVNFLNIQTHKQFVVVTLKFDYVALLLSNESKRCRRNGKQCSP